MALSKVDTVEVEDKTGDEASITSLHEACRCGKLDVVKMGDEALVTSLHEACRCGNLDVVKMGDEALITSLHEACKSGNLDVVKLLVEKGADVNAQNKDQNTPLLEAMNARHLEVVEYLVNQEKIDVNSNKSKHWCSAIHSALYFFRQIRENEFEIRKRIIKRIIDKTDNLNTIGKLGTPLMDAAILNDFEIVKYLIERGASVNTEFQMGDSKIRALEIACNHTDSINMVKLLLSYGAKVNNTASEYFDQPLGNAIKQGDFEVVKELQQYGAQIGKDYVSQNISLMKLCSTPSEIIERKKIDDLLRLNLKFLKNVRSNKFEEVKKTLKEGACINVSTKRSGTALIYASWEQNEDMVDLLLENGADVNIKSAKGHTSLHMACRHNDNGNIAVKLMKNGAYYNQRDDKKNQTPQRHSREGGNNNLYELFKLIDSIFRKVIKKTLRTRVQIICTLRHIQRTDREFFTFLKLVKNCNGDTLMSITSVANNECAFFREVARVLKDEFNPTYFIVNEFHRKNRRFDIDILLNSIFQ